MTPKFQVGDRVITNGGAVGVVIEVWSYIPKLEPTAPGYSVVLKDNPHYVQFAESHLSLYVTPHYFQD